MPVIYWLVLLIVVGSYSLGCGREPEFQIEEKARQDFAVLPGKIGVTIKNVSGEWHRIIRGGTLSNVSSLPKAPADASGGYGEGATGLPKQVGFIYKGPYVTSSDKRYVAASIGIRISDPAPWGVVIIDTRTGKTIATIKVFDDRYLIDGLAWSPNSEWIAVLKHSSRMGEFDLGRLFGHGTPYMTYYLDVVNLSGDVIAHTKLSSEISYSVGWVVWME